MSLQAQWSAFTDPIFYDKSKYPNAEVCYGVEPRKNRLVIGFACAVFLMVMLTWQFIPPFEGMKILFGVVLGLVIIFFYSFQFSVLRKGALLNSKVIRGTPCSRALLDEAKRKGWRLK